MHDCVGQLLRLPRQCDGCRGPGHAGRSRNEQLSKRALAAVTSFSLWCHPTLLESRSASGRTRVSHYPSPVRFEVKREKGLEFLLSFVVVAPTIGERLRRCRGSS